MADAPSSSSRRRGVGAVTSIACTECRKKRSKCDGQTPCARCITQHAQCVYEQPVRQTKDEMRSEIDDLRKHKSQTEEVLSALLGDAAEDVLQRIRRSEPIAEIHKWIESAKSKVGSGYKTTWNDDGKKFAIENAIRSAGNVMGGGAAAASGGDLSFRPPLARHSQSQNPSRLGSYQSSASGASPYVSPYAETPLVMAWSRSPSTGTIQDNRVQGQQILLGPAYTAEAQVEDDVELVPETWTSISDDKTWVYHLMALYFCWEYPTFASLSKDHFLEDFGSHRRRYCSPLLVNAMLALGCRFCDLPEARADPDDASTTGDHFFAEAKHLLANERHIDSLASIQALGLMAIREGSCGRNTESFYYSQLAIRISVEIGLHHDVYIDDQAEREVRRATFWGAFTLDQAWSLSTSKMPHLSYNASFPPKPSIVDSSEMAAWVPYTDQGVPPHIAANQPCNVHSVFKCFCELSTLIHASLYALYSPQKRFTSVDLISHYEKYMQWYDEMPEVLKLGSNFTPSVLFVHLYFHFAVLSLFLPFINLSLPDSHFLPLTLCKESADAITSIIEVYHKLYTLAHTPSMTPYLVLVCAVCQLKGIRMAQLHRAMPRGAVDAGQMRDEEDSIAKQKKFLGSSITALNEMSKCHGFAGRALAIIRYLAEKWDVDVGDAFPSKAPEVARRRSGQGADEEAMDTGSESEDGDAWEKVRPRTDSTNLFVPREGAQVEAEGVLFSVFPLQGLPLVGWGEELERDGFRVLRGGEEWGGAGAGGEGEDWRSGGRRGGADEDVGMN